MAKAEPSNLYFYHTDPAGTALAMTNTSGTVVWKTDYKPFGEEQSITSTIENNEKFAGKEKDKETGMYYFGARYLGPKTGRFVTIDPVGAANSSTSKVNEKFLLNPQKFNRYVYTLNNPYRYVDPLGLWELSINGLNFIAKFEGFSASPYDDVANNATIGYGHLLHYGSVTKADTSFYNNGISEKDALKLLKQDADVSVKAVNNLVKVSLTQNQFDAIVSFTYNVGQGNLKTSSLLMKLNSKEYDAITKELNNWNKAGGIEVQGLTNRRKEEGELFNTK